jgi:hypothetical protein
MGTVGAESAGVACREADMNGERVITFAKEVTRIAVYPVGAVLALSIMRSFWWWGFVILGLLAVIPVIVITIVILVSGSMAIWRREWRKTMVWGTAIILAALVARPILLCGDYVHLAVMYPYYAAQPEYRSGKPFSTGWTSEGFLLTQGCDRSIQFDPSGKTKAEARPLATDSNSYYNWLSVQPLFLKFSVREDCFF